MRAGMQLIGVGSVYWNVGLAPVWWGRVPAVESEDQRREEACQTLWLA